MTPMSVPVATAGPVQPVRPSAALPAAPAPAPLAAPAMVARVEWAGAVRPPDALLRAFRPDLAPRTDPDRPTGPPPAFAANLLDQIPDSLRQAMEAAAAPLPAAGEADPLRGAGTGGADDRATAEVTREPAATGEGATAGATDQAGTTAPGPMAAADGAAGADGRRTAAAEADRPGILADGAVVPRTASSGPTAPDAAGAAGPDGTGAVATAAAAPPPAAGYLRLDGAARARVDLWL